MTEREALKLARTALGVQLDALLGKAGHLRNDDRRRYAENGIKAIDEALAQPEQEPVIDQSAAVRIATVLGWIPPRQPLTKKEVDLILAKHELNFVRGKDRDDLLAAMRDVEAAHSIKGEA